MPHPDIEVRRRALRFSGKGHPGRRAVLLEDVEAPTRLDALHITFRWANFAA